MKEFLYGKTYIVERTDIRVMAFELISRGENFIDVYVRKYNQVTNELEGFEVTLHLSTYNGQERVFYKNDIFATQFYEGELCIYTRKGLEEYDEQKKLEELSL